MISQKDCLKLLNFYLSYISKYRQIATKTLASWLLLFTFLSVLLRRSIDPNFKMRRKNIIAVLFMLSCLVTWILWSTTSEVNNTILVLRQNNYFIRNHLLSPENICKGKSSIRIQNLSVPLKSGATVWPHRVTYNVCFVVFLDLSVCATIKDLFYSIQQS